MATSRDSLVPFVSATTTSSFAHVNPITTVEMDVVAPTSNSSPKSLEESSDWRYRLGELLVGDVVVAVSVTALAAPFLTLIDKALVERSAGSHSVVSSIAASVSSILRQPSNFVRSPTFLWMWGTYAATYSAANTLRTLTDTGTSISLPSTGLGRTDTVSDRSSSNSTTIHTASTVSHTSTASKQQHHSVDAPPVSTVSKSASTTLFVGTALVNSSMSILKDRAYARLYGATATSTSVVTTIPKSTYAFWMLRDLTVIGAAFVLPTHVATVLHDNVLSPSWSLADATRLAQLVTPVAVQIVAGPLHVAGYDVYNRPHFGHSSFLHTVRERVRFLRASYTEVVAARMVRILPGYGLAGVLNTEWRTAWRHHVLLRDAVSTRPFSIARTLST
jgi:hypothetical protein